MAPQFYHPLQRFLHWLMALLIPALFGLGLWMTGLDYYSQWYKSAPDLHKSVGVLLALMLVLRWLALLWLGKPVGQGSQLQQNIATLVHGSLYGLLILILLTGYLISTEDGRPISVFSWFALPAAGKLFDNQADLAGAAHYWLAWTLIGLVVLHVAGAIKHHVIDKDDTLNRMTGRQRPSIKSGE